MIAYVKADEGSATSFQRLETSVNGRLAAAPITPAA